MWSSICRRESVLQIANPQFQRRTERGTERVNGGRSHEDRGQSKLQCDNDGKS